MVLTFPDSGSSLAAVWFRSTEFDLRQSGVEDDRDPGFIGAKHGMALITMRSGDYAGALVWLNQLEPSEGAAGVNGLIDECRRQLK